MKRLWNPFLLWIAQGFGVGRIPVAPGTLGTLLGVGWFLLLLQTGGMALFLTGLLGGVALSIWLCDRAEEILGETDPESVVLDELAAVPICFLSWLGLYSYRLGRWPDATTFFGDSNWIWGLGLLVAFRILDIAKPGWIGRSQTLRGGIGVTVDDLLAAAGVALIALPFFAWLLPPE